MVKMRLLVFACCVVVWCGNVQCLYPMMCEQSSPDLPVRKPRPWMARVVPHLESAHITLCIASCIHPKLFYTASRCLIGLTIGWAGLDYHNDYVKIKAILTTRGPPYHESDGFIITGTTSDGQWTAVAYYKGPALKLADYKNKQGLAMMKVMTLVIMPDEGTVELDVVLDHNMVNKRYDIRSRYNGTYNQWGFHPCTDKELEEALVKCGQYIKVTGAPLVFYDRSSGQEMVIGVSTWADCSSREANYPVAISYIRGKEEKDLECAKLIAKDNVEHPAKGYYDNLCRSRIAKPAKGWDYERE